MIAVHDFKDREVAVFGLGRSGLAAARALRAGEARVVAWDDDPAGRAKAADAGLAVVDLLAADWRDTAALVLSPGVPLTHPEPHPVVVKARAAGTEVIGDVELFVRATPGRRKTAISGTNGKSTTTALIGHILKTSGRATEVGGNLGNPVLDLAPLAADGDYVIELSSYQIDLTPSLRADVAVLLNISPDHLDRHGGLAGYVAVKHRLFAGQDTGDVAVIGVDDDHCRRIHDALGATARQRVVAVSVGRQLDDGVHVRHGQLIDAIGGGDRPVLDLAELIDLPGQHNWQNAACAYAACRALGLAVAEIVAGLRSFPGLPHRMERLAEIDGVLFVNDSKATNAAAAARALACFEAVYWIAGGRGKAGGIAGLSPYFERIRHAFLIGEAARDMAETLKSRVPCSMSGDLARAVAAAHQQARAEARPDAVVLLSPACASFDQFADFEARGEAFRAAVQRLPGGAR